MSDEEEAAEEDAAAVESGEAASLWIDEIQGIVDLSNQRTQVALKRKLAATACVCVWWLRGRDFAA